MVIPSKNEIATSRYVLFLCTGNYYRSRFAEELFNYLASKRFPDIRANSRGLATDFTTFNNVGPISRATIKGLEERNIILPANQRHPLRVAAQDLAESELIVALNEIEHRPMVDEHFPDYREGVEYWQIGDGDVCPPHKALSEIESKVMELLNRFDIPAWRERGFEKGGKQALSGRDLGS